MRKFIFSIIFGVILCMPTAVLASDSVQAYLSPSRILFHFNNAVKEIEVSGGNGVLYYQDRAYIPLRTFSTTMGATINYEAPSPTNGNFNIIDVYYSSGEIENKPSHTSTDFATGPVQVFLSPSKVFFHINNTTKEIDVSGDSKIIYFRDRAYIPLRAFSTAMGATISYAAPSASTGNLNRIDIYSPSSLTFNNLTIQDPDGYVSIGNLNTHKDENGRNLITSGTIKANKDLTGKTIDIYYLIQQNRQISYVYIQNEDIEKLKVGDVRPFQTNLIFNEKVAPVAVDVHDTLKLETWETIAKNNGDPIAIMMGPILSTGEVDMGKVLPSQVLVFNSSDHDLTVEPFNMEIDIYALTQVGTKERVYNCKLPMISGKIPGKSGFNITAFWNQNNLNGGYVLPGEYIASLTVPVIYYSPSGSNDRISYDIAEHSGMRPCGYSFKVINVLNR